MDEIGEQNHGTWVWECAHSEGNTLRSARLGVTQESEPQIYSHYLVAVEASVQRGSHTEASSVSNFIYPELGLLFEGIESDVAPSFIEAMRRASLLEV